MTGPVRGEEANHERKKSQGSREEGGVVVVPERYRLGATNRKRKKLGRTAGAGLLSWGTTMSRTSLRVEKKPSRVTQNPA